MRKITALLKQVHNEPLRAHVASDTARHRGLFERRGFHSRGEVVEKGSILEQPCEVGNASGIRNDRPSHSPARLY